MDINALSLGAIAGFWILMLCKFCTSRVPL